MTGLIRKTIGILLGVGIFLTCGYLDAATLPGLISVGKTSFPPVVDGKLNDKCWENSIEVTPFIKTYTTDKKAEEQTKVYISYDEKNLYFAFYCVQVCLDPLQNQLHMFKKNTRSNDDNNLFNDDWITVLIQPETGKNVFFDIFINANGAVNDASCSGSAAVAWSKRDTKWNSGITAKSHLGDGFWTLEFSIPFENLMLVTAKNKTFGIQLGRRNTALKENSIWQGMAKPFHDPEHFGRLVLKDSVPQVRDIKFSEFTMGPNTMSCMAYATDKNLNLRLESLVLFALAKTGGERKNKDFNISGKKDLVLDYPLEKEGDFSIQFEIVNPLNLKTFYRTPAYHSSVKSSALKADISGSAAYEIYLNGDKIDREGFILKGENILCIKTDGPIKGGFTVGDTIFPLDGTWKYSPLLEDNWKTKMFKDAGWKLAQVENGQLNQKGFYRKSIVLNSSRFWPNWEGGGISIAQNSIQQLFMLPEGIRGKTLENYHFYIEVPEEFEVIGASAYCNKDKVRSEGFSLVKSEKVIRNNRNYIKHYISTAAPLKFNDKANAYKFVSIMVRLPEQKEYLNKTEFYYYMSAENGNIIEVPQRLAVNVLPPLKGVSPSKYIIQLWSGSLGDMDDADLRENLLHSLAEMGFNEVLYHIPMPSSVKLRNVALLTFNTWCINCVPYLKEHPDEALMDIRGNRHYTPSNPRKNHICTTLLLEDLPAWKHVEKEIEKWIKKSDLKHVNWDYENSVWDDKNHGYLVCVCPRCIAKFREFAKIPAGTELNMKIIRESHRAQWIKFMNMRQAELAGKLRAVVKKVSNDIIFSVYSAYQTEQYKEEYGIDWKMLADKIDYAMCGYERPEKELNDTLSALGKTPLVVGELIYPHNTAELRYPRYASKAILLRRVSDSTGGILIYNLTPLDGRTFYAVAEISRLIKDYEPLFLSRKKDNSLVEVSGVNPNNVVVFTDGKTRLVMLINEDKIRRKATLTNRNFGNDMNVYDYFAGKDLGHAEKINIEIAPYDTAVFVVK